MLGNCAKPFPARMVNPKNFVELYKRIATCESLYRAEEIMDEWRIQKRSAPVNDPVFDYMSMLGAIYEAGRVQGIREERSKKKRA